MMAAGRESMSVKRVTSLVVACLVFGLSACLGMNAMAERTKGESQLPLRKLVVTLNKAQHEAFFEQLRKFADRRGFAIRIAPTTPSGEDFSIEMWRSDFKIFGANPFDPGEFKIGIYDNDAKGVPAEYLDALVAELKSFLAEVPTATVAE